MPAGESSRPLLGDSDEVAHRASEERREENGEDEPLLSHGHGTPRYDGVEDHTPLSPATTSLRSIQSSDSSYCSSSATKGRSWATITAITGLSMTVLLIISVLFFAPAAVEEYSKQSMVVDPYGLSIDSFTSTGVRARVQADFHLDAMKCRNSAIRTFGRLGTYIAHTIETEETEVKVYLPEYDNLLLGTATIPKVHASIRNGEVTHLDFLTDVKPAGTADLQRIVNDWLSGRMTQLTVRGMADVSLKSGLFHLGSKTIISPTIVLEGHNIPNIPSYNITHINIEETNLMQGLLRKAIIKRGMRADATIVIDNHYPISLSIPPLQFDILVQNCDVVDPYIMLAEASTDLVNVQPESDIEVKAGGIIRELPGSLTKPCPSTTLSPLDVLVGEYMHGKDATIYVKGSKNPSPETPTWISDLIAAITVPVPFPGRSFDGLVKNFTFADVHFGLPDPFADPRSPESNPQISGTIVVMAKLPEEVNFGINVSNVRPTAEIFYKDKKLGVMDLKEWQKARSERIEATDDEVALLKIQSKIKDAPINITDQGVFQDVAQKILFGEGVTLEVRALVDVEAETVLGSLVVRELPGEGSVPVKAPANGGLKGALGGINPQVFDLKILDTGKTSLTLEGKVNFTNPTNYTATIPEFNIHILSNDSVIGLATVSNAEVTLGNNTNLVVRVLWDPATLGDANSSANARNLISQYISGWNTTLTFQTFHGTIPALPALGESLSKFPIEMEIPRLSSPHNGSGDDDDDEDTPDHLRFIQGATFHILSSSASFTIFSPLKDTPIFIETINATAFYNHTEPVGTIVYDLPLEIPPGLSETTKLPVEWDPESIGYDRIREALGGGLKLSAKAEVGVRLGKWKEKLWFEGEGIGAKVRL
ncbi:hypothetical protein V498_05431 [Pseudogymnoascus sp. VKM F-4517 (FW-2822)]|nr:hypothetical protein V498_05431 [Pseudogymnoascus sp. VKM F-4517 (FW-2822)]